MKISPKQISTALTSPRILTPAVFLGIGAAKTFKDYQNEPAENKKQILIKDTSVLAGASAGCALSAIIFNKFFNYELFNTNKKVLKNIEYILKQTCSSVLTSLLGVSCAILLHEPVEKFIIKKLKKNIIIEKPKENFPITNKQNEVFKDFIAATPQNTIKTAGKVITNISDLPSMRVFSAPMVALTSFSVANTSGYDNKVKKTTKEILANTLIPTIFVSATAIFANKQKSFIKYPSLLLSLAAGTITGNYIADKTEKHINKTVDIIFPYCQQTPISKKTPSDQTTNL